MWNSRSEAVKNGIRVSCVWIIGGICCHVVQNLAHEIIVSPLNVRTDGVISLLPDVVDRFSTVASVGEELGGTKARDLARIKNVVALNASSVRRNVNGVPYYFDYDFGATSGGGAGDGKKKCYYRITVSSAGRVSGKFYPNSRNSTFTIHDADIDIGSDGKTWFHLFGLHCLSHLEGFETDNRF
jgi:hypothetical protein